MQGPVTYIPPSPQHVATILEALTEGRQTLLNDALPLFSTKSRSKSSAPAPQQPPHTLTPISTSTMTIGPHSFPQTKLFVADWGETSSRRRGKAAAAPSTAPSSPGKLAGAAGAITPALIQRLNAASTKDTHLATVLRKAASGQANPQELAYLAKYIKSVEKEDADKKAAEAGPVASTSQQQDAAEEPAGPPALVIEFQESAGQRFTLPSHYTYTELHATPAAKKVKAVTSDVLLSFFLFPTSKGKEKEGYFSDGAVPVPVDVIVEQCTEDVKDALLRCSRTGRARESSVESWWKRMITSVAPRLHIIDPPPAPPAPEPVPAASLPMLSRTASNSIALAAADSGSATPVARRPAKGGARRRPPARRGGASRAKSTTAEATPGPSSTGASPKPETKPRSSSARPPRKGRQSVPSKRLRDEMEAQTELEQTVGVDKELLG